MSYMSPAQYAIEKRKAGYAWNRKTRRWETQAEKAQQHGARIAEAQLPEARCAESEKGG